MRTLSVLIAALLLPLLFSFPATAADGGVIEGRVINGSQGGGPVGGLEVTLSIDPAGEQLTARTDPSGQFRFEGLPTAADGAYTLAVRYQGVDYAVGGIEMDGGGPAQKVEVRVYETTTSAQAVIVLLDHQMVVARPDDRRLEVVSYMKVVNRGDRTVVGPAAGESLRLSLPEGAENVRFLGAVSETGTLVDERLSSLDQAIPPGEHELMFDYELPYVGSSFLFRKTLDYRTEKAVFLMSVKDARAESPQLPARKEADTAAGAHQILIGEDLPAGTVLEVTLSGLPTGGGISLQRILAPAAAILVILALGGIVVYVRYRRGRVAARPAEE